MDHDERAEIVAACERLVVDYTHLIDLGRAAAVADLFADDGVWSSPEFTMEGRAAIAAAFAQRQAMDRTSTHVCSNVAIDVVDRDHARGVSYLTLYRFDGVDERPAPLEGPTLVGRYEDTFVRTGDGWRFQSRSTVVTFLRR